MRVTGAGGPTLPVSIANGGTGSTTAAAALAALGGSATGNHAKKSGSNAGDYSITANAFADIDATNLNVSITVPTGSVALAWLTATGKSPAGQSIVLGIAVDGTVQGSVIIGGGVSGIPIPMSSIALLVGDGSSHTFKPQAFVSSGTGTILNSGNNDPPNFVVLVVSAT